MNALTTLAVVFLFLAMLWICIDTAMRPSGPNCPLDPTWLGFCDEIKNGGP